MKVKTKNDKSESTTILFFSAQEAQDALLDFAKKQGTAVPSGNITLRVRQNRVARGVPIRYSYEDPTEDFGLEIRSA